MRELDIFIAQGEINPFPDVHIPGEDVVIKIGEIFAKSKSYLSSESLNNAIASAAPIAVPLVNAGVELSQNEDETTTAMASCLACLGVLVFVGGVIVAAGRKKSVPKNWDAYNPEDNPKIPRNLNSVKMNKDDCVYIKGQYGSDN